jgi:hypothetical protein
LYNPLKVDATLDAALDALLYNFENIDGPCAGAFGSTTCAVGTTGAGAFGSTTCAFGSTDGTTGAGAVESTDGTTGADAFGSTTGAVESTSIGILYLKKL